MERRLLSSHSTAALQTLNVITVLDANERTTFSTFAASSTAFARVCCIVVAITCWHVVAHNEQMLRSAGDLHVQLSEVLVYAWRSVDVFNHTGNRSKRLLFNPLCRTKAIRVKVYNAQLPVVLKETALALTRLQPSDEKVSASFGCTKLSRDRQIIHPIDTCSATACAVTAGCWMCVRQHQQAAWGVQPTQRTLELVLGPRNGFGAILGWTRRVGGAHVSLRAGEQGLNTCCRPTPITAHVVRYANMHTTGGLA